jgi:SAM-dependent methyltransferase
MTAGETVYSDEGHLSYYTRHGVSPVRYEIGDLHAHFCRRDALFRRLGVPPQAFRGSRVLEVAAGSGHNSLFVAACRPAELHLIEPNPAGRADIAAAYASLTLPHTAPRLHAVRLEEFTDQEPFDIVICENWLGWLPKDRAAIRQLSSLVVPGGILVLTSFPAPGFLANVVRKIMADILSVPGEPFERRADRMVAAFGPHLSTMPSMTRSHRDWVIDCMLNSHFLNVILPVDVVLDEIGADMDITGSSPAFHHDWRWFKSLSGDRTGNNALFQASYLGNVHNFIDHRLVLPARNADANRTLEQACLDFHSTAITIERDFDPAVAGPQAALALVRVIAAVGECHRTIADALAEAAEWLAAPCPSVETVATMRRFNGLFGRECTHLSLVRRHS